MPGLGAQLGKSALCFGGEFPEPGKSWGHAGIDFVPTNTSWNGTWCWAYGKGEQGDWLHNSSRHIMSGSLHALKLKVFLSPHPQYFLHQQLVVGRERGIHQTWFIPARINGIPIFGSLIIFHGSCWISGLYPLQHSCICILWIQWQIKEAAWTYHIQWKSHEHLSGQRDLKAGNLFSMKSKLWSQTFLLSPLFMNALMDIYGSVQVGSQIASSCVRICPQ